MTPRPFFSTLCFTSLLLGTLTSSAQPDASTPNDGLSISHNAGTEHFHLQWWAKEDNHYFIEISEDLQEWQLVPLTMEGANTPANYGFSSSSDKLFLRLVYAEDPDTAFRSRYPAPDPGELPDWWQIFYFQALGIDPQGDVSGNTFSNVWHYENAEHPFDFFLDDEPTIQIDSGDGQTGDAGAILPQTLRVLIEVDGQPSVNAPVVFEVPSGLGLVRDSANGGAWGKRVTVRTDVSGYAEVQFRLPFALDYTAAIDTFPDVFKNTPPDVFFEAFTLGGFGTQRLTAGSWHSAALDGEGQVWTWGRNHYGQLGDGSTVDKWFPQVVSEL
ncbi:MAG: hypothetical protein JJT75_11950, partial [Opitutales bacterium]|nr:hypothetical protein [Opitutales bacterium]